MCKDVESSSQGRSWKAGGKGGRRGAPLQVGNQDSSPGSQPVNPSRLAADNNPEESSIGKSGKLWWECGGGDQQLSILLKLQSQSQPAPLPSFFSCFASFQQQSQASLLLNPLDGTDRHECNCCQLAPTGPAAQSNVCTAYSSFYCPALLKLPAVASAPIHAPYWRRRGLSGQIISPPPSPQSPYQPLGRPHFKPSSTSSLCYLSPLRYVRDKRPQGRKQGWLAPEVPTTTCKAFKV